MNPLKPLSDLAYRLMVPTAIGLLYYESLTGFLRYFMYTIHFNAFFYLKPLAAVACVVVPLGLRLLTLQVSGREMAVLALVAFGALYSLLVGAIPGQVGVGLYAAIMILVGVFGPRELWEAVRRHSPLLWAIAITGVLIDIWYDFPWKGFEFEVGGMTKTAAREWLAEGGFERVSGFTYSNFGAAFQILIYSLPLYFHPRLKPVFKLAMWALTGFAIWHTTAKIALIALAVITPMMLLRALTPPDKSLRAGFTATMAALAGIMTALPLWYVFVAPGSLKESGNSFLFFTLDTIASRANENWPWAFSLISDAREPIEWLMGRGFGSIGAGLSYLYQRDDNYSSENFFIYIYLTMGLLSFVLMGLLIRGAWRQAQLQNHVYPLLVGCCVMIIGVTNSLMDSSILTLMLGCMLAGLIKPRPQAAEYDVKTPVAPPKPPFRHRPRG